MAPGGGDQYLKRLGKAAKACCFSDPWRAKLVKEGQEKFAEAVTVTIKGGREVGYLRAVAVSVMSVPLRLRCVGKVDHATVANSSTKELQHFGLKTNEVLST